MNISFFYTAQTYIKFQQINSIVIDNNLIIVGKSVRNVRYVRYYNSLITYIFTLITYIRPTYLP